MSSSSFVCCLISPSLHNCSSFVLSNFSLCVAHMIGLPICAGSLAASRRLRGWQVEVTRPAFAGPLLLYHQLIGQFGFVCLFSSGMYMTFMNALCCCVCTAPIAFSRLSLGQDFVLFHHCINVLFLLSAQRSLWRRWWRC